jgi:hypothetical protein
VVLDGHQPAVANGRSRAFHCPGYLLHITTRDHYGLADVRVDHVLRHASDVRAADPPKVTAGQFLWVT